MNRIELRHWLSLYQQPYSVWAQVIESIGETEGGSFELLEGYTNRLPGIDEPLIEDVEAWLGESEQHHLLTCFDLPLHLKAIPDPPLLLFCVGDLNCLNLPMLAVIGSRNPSHAGRGHASEICADLALSGWTLVSGMAQGIDGIAHKQALNERCPTIAVLGTGHRHDYPARHAGLARQIEKQGLSISEYLPSMGPRKHQFPRRNRLISGLAHGVVVIEAASRSGTLITCEYAAEQGRDVFAMPGDINNPKVAGCHRLIREGAILVTHAAQINEHFGRESNSEPGRLNGGCQESEQSLNLLSKEEQAVYQAVDWQPLSVNQIQNRLSMKLELVLSVLFSLELKGLVTQSACGYLRRQPE